MFRLYLVFMKSLLRFLSMAIILLMFTQSLFAASLKLALNWKAEPQFGGFYAAQILGQYKKQGLEIEILEGGSGTPTVQMLANGKVDLAIVSAEEIIISQERNPKNKVVAIFAVFQTNPQAILTREERGFQKLQDIFKNEGVLALQSGLSYAQFLINKMKPIQVKLVPYQGGIGHLLADRKYSQQGFSTSEPLLAEKSGLKVKTFLVADEGFNPYTTVLATTEAHLNDKEFIRKIRQAVSAGWQAYLRDPTATNEKMALLNKSMDPELFKKSAAAQKALIETPETDKAGIGTMTLQRWKALSEQLIALKIIKNSSDPSRYFVN
jgi:NitT/TauT family transport system substrate-binding protein